MDKNILILILILIFIFFGYHLFFNRSKTSTINLNLNHHQYSLEIAKTIPQQAKGLMGRTTLCPNCGMIFIFNLEIIQSFWMKNTLLPLDMIFLDHRGSIINITTAYPEPNIPDSQLKLYHSTSPAKYVIELNAGETQKISLKPGDVIDISPL